MAAIIDHGNGTVTDPRTGLQWEQCPDGTYYIWVDAMTLGVAAVNAVALGGHTDWRMPTIQELTTLVDTARPAPRIDPLLSTAPRLYWSATIDTTIPTDAWAVDFADGLATNDNDQHAYCLVRMVRNLAGIGA